MENKIQIFKNSQFGEIRTITNEQGEAYVAAIDVCKTLGYSNPRDAIKTHVDIEDVAKYDTLTNGGIQQITFINESGLYSLIIGSKLESAKTFKKWITSEVLPSIRKTGGYLIVNDNEGPEEIMARALLVAKDTMDRQAKRIKEQEDKIMLDEPKVIFSEAVENSDRCILIGELAKYISQNGYNIGQNRLFECLRQSGYLCSRKGEQYNLPSQKSIEMDLFEIKKQIIDKPNGQKLTTSTTVVTGKGQIYFVNKFVNNKINLDN